MSNPEMFEAGHNSCVLCPALHQKASRNEEEIEKLWKEKSVLDSRIDGIKNILIGLLSSSILTLVGIIATLVMVSK